MVGVAHSALETPPFQKQSTAHEQSRAQHSTCPANCVPHAQRVYGVKPVPKMGYMYTAHQKIPPHLAWRCSCRSTSGSELSAQIISILILRTIKHPPLPPHTPGPAVQLQVDYLAKKAGPKN